VYTDDWLVIERGDGYLDACVARVAEHLDARLLNYSDGRYMPPFSDPIWADLTELRTDYTPDGDVQREFLGRHGANLEALRVAGLLPAEDQP
jgi:hypothetical protein